MWLKNKVLRKSLILLSVVPLSFILCTTEHRLTPFERASGESVTSYESMIRFIGELDQATDFIKVETFGSSVEGRDIPLLRISGPSSAEEDQSEKITVMIYAQVNGDEHSGKEAALRLARDIAEGSFSEFLHNVDLLLIPQVNPDGAERGQKTNANNVDLDQDHLELSQPEVYALHRVFHRYMPEVTLDVQEYETANEAWKNAGYEKRFGVQMGAVSNPNVSIVLRRYSWERLLPEMERDMRLKNIRFRRFLNVDDPEKRFMHSSASLRSGRGALGIHNTLSYDMKAPKGGSGVNTIYEKTNLQYESIKTFLSILNRNAAEIKRIVSEEREKLTRGTSIPRVHIEMDYTKDPANVSITAPVLSIETGAETEVRFDNYYPLVGSVKSVTRPLGYAIPPENDAITQILEKHGIEIHMSEVAVRGVLELYTINSVTRATVEEHDITAVDVSVRSRISTIPAGYKIVWCNDIHSSLVVSMLEPHSIWGLAQSKTFSSLLAAGSSYPVIRIIRIID